MISMTILKNVDVLLNCGPQNWRLLRRVLHIREGLIWTPPGDQVIFAWWFAGKVLSLISGLLVQAVSLLALMEFADEILSEHRTWKFTFPARLSSFRSYLFAIMC